MRGSPFNWTWLRFALILDGVSGGFGRLWPRRRGGADPTADDTADTVTVSVTADDSPTEDDERLSQTVSRRERLGVWLARPGTRLGLHGLATASVLAAAVVAGLYVVPLVADTRAAGEAARPRPSTSAPAPLPTDADRPSLSPTFPSGSPSPSPGDSRGNDGLTPWVTGLDHLGIPPVALRAYGYAELSLARTQPNCHLTWTTLAGIGKNESSHGRTNGATLREDGTSEPRVLGLPLDGSPGRKLIRDTDGGQLDGDRVYDRAVGPLQFIPSTWRRWATDGDGDGTANPFDIDDAAVAAGRYLCAGGRDLATPQGWWQAILSYNAVDAYVRSVFTAADDYGRRSRTR